MSKYINVYVILIALISFILGHSLWAYPTGDGVSFGFGDFGYFYEYK